MPNEAESRGTPGFVGNDQAREYRHRRDVTRRFVDFPSGDVPCGGRSEPVPGAFIYILLCSDGTTYTGLTRRSVDQRVSEHAPGLVEGCYTASRRPVTLLFSEHYDRIDEATAAERRIESWSRTKKEAYMRGDFERLSVPARRAKKAKESGPDSDPSS